ncbi:secretin N-terminal domain-containing protein [Nitrospira sp. Nam80]
MDPCYRPRHVLILLLLMQVVGAAFFSGCAGSDLRKAEHLAARGEWDSAVEAYRLAVKHNPSNRNLQLALERAKQQAAHAHFLEGRKQLDQKELPLALQEFKLATGLNPMQLEYQSVLADALKLKEARDLVQVADQLGSLGRYDDAMESYKRAVEFDPSLTAALDGITQVTRQQREEKGLGRSRTPVTLRFQGTKLREVFEVLARAEGVNLIFDKDVKGDDPITIFVKETPVNEALNLIMATNGLSSRRIGPDTLLVFPTNKQKQDLYEDLMVRTFYLANAKAKEMVNVVRTLLEAKHIYVNEQLNALVIRDRPQKLQLAERIILANDRREPEVLLELEVLEVDHTKFLQYGVDFAKKVTASLAPPGGQAGAFAFQQLTSLGSGSYAFTLPGTITIDFLKQEADAKTLAAPKLRVLNNRLAKINVGDKQPILLSTSNVLPGQAATGAIPVTSTVTSIEFKDTGVKLTVEPNIQLMNEVTLKLQIEVTTLGEQVELQASPPIRQFKFGTRMAETILNLKDGETVVLGGLLQDTEKAQRSTVPWLGDLPILRHLLSSVQTNETTTEVVLTITPHIVRGVTPPAVETQYFWSGTATSFATEPLFSNTGRNSLRRNASHPAESLPSPSEPDAKPAQDLHP